MAPPSEPNPNPMDAIAHLDRTSFPDEAARIKALNQARALCRRLETPWEALAREMWFSPSTAVAIKIAQDLGLFTVLAQHEPAQPVQILAQATNSNPDFLHRILRYLASIDFLTETDTGCFLGTEISRAFTLPGYTGGMMHLFTQVMPVFQHLPTFTAKHDYMNPEDPRAGPFQAALGTQMPLFEWLATHPVEGRGFNDLMNVVHDQPALDWTNAYPMTELTNVALDKSTPLIVDVGGGVGHDMEIALRALHPETHELAVQDLPGVIEQAKTKQTPQSITFHAHNFFTPQPIHGARAYYMHSILHDWPDTQARQILLNLKSAMRPGYSKLLLFDIVLAERAKFPSLDLVMMGLLCARERTGREWRALLEGVGMRVVRIRGGDGEGVGRCVIEAELVVEEEKDEGEGGLDVKI